jgi:hypothetical protein
MNKYNKGKIYKIVDNTNGDVYIGSTIQTLKERMISHKHNKNCSSINIIKNGDYNIILVENYPCNSKKELETRERYYIENNECINERIPGRTTKERYQDNREKILEYQQEYRIKNPEILKNTKHEYYEKNKEKINNKNKEWRKNNSDKVIEYRKYIKQYKKSWGGDVRSNNNLLLIDPLLFQN